MDDNGNSEALIGYGAGFYLGRTDADMIEIDEVTKIPFAEEAADDVAVTHFKSPKKRKEYKGGMIEPGEDTLEINYIPGSPTDIKLREAHQSGQPYKYEAYLPAPQNKWWKISGYLIVKSRGRNVDIENRMQQTINVRFTGAADEASAATQPVIAGA